MRLLDMTGRARTAWRGGTITLFALMGWTAAAWAAPETERQRVPGLSGAINPVNPVHPPGAGAWIFLKEIEVLLLLRADPTTDCANVRERAQTKLEGVNNKIARLAAIQSALKSLIDACPGQGAVRSCSILEALEFYGTDQPLP